MERMCPCCGNCRGCDCATNAHITRLRAHLEAVLRVLPEDDIILADIRARLFALMGVDDPESQPTPAEETENQALAAITKRLVALAQEADAILAARPAAPLRHDLQRIALLDATQADAEEAAQNCGYRPASEERV